MSAIYDRFMRASEDACLRAWRHELLADLSGSVLEVGAGTGANLAHYPAGVTRLVLTEPDVRMARQLQTRLDAEPRAGVELVHADAEALPFADGSFDAVVATLLLCSVASPDRALAEIQRVLRPGGVFVFLEHVAAGDGTSRRAWQERLEPMWKHVAGNCHVTRDTQQAILASGLQLGDVQAASMRRALPILRPTIRGVAHKAAPLTDRATTPA
jgi:ubiquinone/menaquinone biosynthesis C-methylase UbiE